MRERERDIKNFHFKMAVENFPVDKHFGSI